MYRRHTAEETPLSRLFERLGQWLATLFEKVNHSPPTQHVLTALLILIVLGVIAHLVLTVYIPGSVASARWSLRARGAEPTDPWGLARRFAADGKYTEAAHALYLTLLDRVAARVPLRLHPSKTAGDYARELRQTAPTIFGLFREFARSYEVVIYGLGECDRPRFDGLIDLAGRIDPELTQLARVSDG